MAIIERALGGSIARNVRAVLPDVAKDENVVLTFVRYLVIILEGWPREVEAWAVVWIVLLAEVQRAMKPKLCWLLIGAEIGMYVGHSALGQKMPLRVGFCV